MPKQYTEQPAMRIDPSEDLLREPRNEQGHDRGRALSRTMRR